MTRGKKTTPSVIIGDSEETRHELVKHSSETAISAANRVCEFRRREIDQIVQQHVDLIPAEVRSKSIKDL